MSSGEAKFERVILPAIVKCFRRMFKLKVISERFCHDRSQTLLQQIKHTAIRYDAQKGKWL